MRRKSCVPTVLRSCRYRRELSGPLCVFPAKRKIHSLILSSSSIISLLFYAVKLLVRHWGLQVQPRKKLAAAPVIMLNHSASSSRAAMAAVARITTSPAARGRLLTARSNCRYLQGQCQSQLARLESLNTVSSTRAFSTTVRMVRTT